MPASTLGEVIAKGRIKERLSQEALAARVDCSVAMIGKIEAGARVPSSELLALIGRHLGLDPVELEKLREKAQPKRGASALVGAARLGRENARRANDLKRRVGTLITSASQASSQFEAAGTKVIEGLASDFAKAMAVVDDVPSEFLVQGETKPSREGADPGVGDAFRRAQREFKGRFRDFFTVSATGVGAGGAVGAAAGIGTYAAVASFATASTGTAIASLSGAAATSATLAWLGGGALAVGGAGIAGGTAVLASIVAVPLVAVAGGVLLGQGSQILKKQQANEKRLLEAERVQSANEKVVATFVDRVGGIQNAVTVAEVKWRVARNVLRRNGPLARAMDASAGTTTQRKTQQRVSFADLTEQQQRALETLGVVVAALGALLTLPIALKVTTAKLPKLVSDAASDEEKGSEQPVLDPGTPKEREYIKFAMEQLLAEIAMA